MTEITDDARLKQVRIGFLAKKEKQIALQLVHEESENFGMAYLSLWAIVEDFATRLGPICQRAELKRSLQEWQTFLSGESSVSPRKISSGNFDLASEVTARIPPESLLTIVIAIEVAPSFYELLDSKKKYRKRRNLVAHSGEAASKEVYEDFREKILLALNEIETWLSDMSPSKVNGEHDGRSVNPS
jgi:hypothetical protein